MIEDSSKEKSQNSSDGTSWIFQEEKLFGYPAGYKEIIETIRVRLRLLKASLQEILHTITENSETSLVPLEFTNGVRDLLNRLLSDANV